MPLAGAHPIDFVMTTGDNIYPDGAPAYFQSNFFEPYTCLLNEGVEFHATLGNHDVVTENGQPELDEPAFGMLGYNYVLRESGVRFVMANSNSIDREWLESATRSETGDLWTMAVFHHPVYSPGQHGPTPGLRPWINRLFQKRGVDLVLNGHDHVYAARSPCTTSGTSSRVAAVRASTPVTRSGSRPFADPATTSCMSASMPRR